MIIDQWAARWKIPVDAVNELKQRMGVFPLTPVPEAADTSEGEIQAQVRLSASRQGIKLFRNNVGAGKLENGSFVRWGLCNDSNVLNNKMKSSDLIGIRPIVISPYHVGQTLGQFIAREVKGEGWTYKGTPREEAQLRFIEWVITQGGDACFTSVPGGNL